MTKHPVSSVLLTMTCAYVTCVAGFAQSSLDGVSLGGNPSAPLIINSSSHRVLAYALMFQGANGVSSFSSFSMLGQLRDQPTSNVGIAPGASWAHNSRPTVVQAADAKGQSPFAFATSVALDSVLFEDGRLVGPDKAGSYDQLTALVQAEKDVHDIITTAKDLVQAWRVLENIAAGQTRPARDPSQSDKYWRRYLVAYRNYSTELLQARSNVGDTAAINLAHMYMFKPKIVKGD